jgi:hypothetical protein
MSPAAIIWTVAAVVVAVVLLSQPLAFVLGGGR